MALVFVALSKNRIRNLTLIAFIAMAGYLLAPAEFKDRFVDMEQSDTALARLDFWERGIGFYQEHPVLGVGYNNYQAYYAVKYPEDRNHVGLVMVAHSVPVTLSAETGTLGIAFFFLVVVSVFVTNHRSARLFSGIAPPFWRYVASSLNYGLIGFLVTGIFLSTAFYPFLWFQAGLSAALYRIATGERDVHLTSDVIRGRGPGRRAVPAPRIEAAR
jgi:O-antigen ligase